MQLNKKAAGKQDQYASAYGGLLKLFIDKKGKTSVKKLNISKKNSKSLKKIFFLFI